MADTLEVYSSCCALRQLSCCVCLVTNAPTRQSVLLPYSIATGQEEDDEDEEDEGWGVVQAPYLPPPPSQPDAVEHWARAMFADGNALSSGQAQSGSYGLGLGLAMPRGYGYGGQVGLGAGRLGLGAAALGSSPSSTAGGMLPMERIRSLFGRSE